MPPPPVPGTWVSKRGEINPWVHLLSLGTLLYFLTLICHVLFAQKHILMLKSEKKILFGENLVEHFSEKMSHNWYAHIWS